MSALNSLATIDILDNPDLNLLYRMRLVGVIEQSQKLTTEQSKRRNLCVGLNSFKYDLGKWLSSGKAKSLEEKREMEMWLEIIKGQRAQINEILEISPQNLGYHKEQHMLDLTDKILKEVSTPEEWASMKTEIKRRFKIFGMGLEAIAKKFDLRGNPNNNHALHLTLGEKIYGEGYECLKYKKEPTLSRKKLLAKIVEKIKTAKEWAEMTKAKKQSFNIDEIGLIAIARKFRLDGNPVKKPSVYLELGRKIFGKEHECLQYKEKPKLSLEELRAAILELVPTPEEWAGMKVKKKRQFKIEEIGLIAIATKFGLQLNPLDRHSEHLELGKKIYGEDHECLQPKKRQIISLN